MASDNVYGTLYNADVVPFTPGMVVRISGARRGVRAQADSTANVQGLAGVNASGIVGVGGPANIASVAFRQKVLCETGLTLAAGQTLYVSPTTAGCATNIAPAIAVAIGVVEDVGSYASDARVFATVTCTPAAAGSSSAYVQAAWSIDGVRVYAVSGTNGSDARAGFADSPDTTAGSFATASAAAGLVAKRTIAGLAAVLPRVGAGRRVHIFLESGTYAESLTSILNGLEGYERVSVWATSTQANAGATAFAGTAASNLFAGAITVPGLNAAGYNPTGVPTTSVVQCVLNGGGAPALPAEPAAPLGWRIRFDINTATAALRGICKTIQKVAGGDTLTLDTVLSTPPAAGDVFYIEKAGVILTGTTTISLAACHFVNIAGIDFNGQLDVQSGNVVFALCSCTSLTVQAPALTHFARIAQIGIGTNVAVGGGIRNAGSTLNSTYGGQRFNWAEGAFVGSVELLDPAAASAMAGVVFAGGLILQGGALAAQGSDLIDMIGGSPTSLPLRIIGAGATSGLLLRGTRLGTRSIDITNMGAKPAIKIDGATVLFIQEVISGSTGNTDVGLDLVSARGTLVVLNATPTVTGTAGNVRLSNGTIITWAQAAAGVVDPAGNVIYASPNSPLKPTPITNGVGATTLGSVGPAGVAGDPVRWVRIPDGAGGFFTYPSWT